MDLFLIPGIIRDKMDETRGRFAREMHRFAY